LSTEDFRERVQVRIIDPHAEATDENTSDDN
jgi:hypothetical protein